MVLFRFIKNPFIQAVLLFFSILLALCKFICKLLLHLFNVSIQHSNFCIKFSIALLPKQRKYFLLL